MSSNKKGNSKKTKPVTMTGGIPASVGFSSMNGNSTVVTGGIPAGVGFSMSGK